MISNYEFHFTPRLNVSNNAMGQKRSQVLCRPKNNEAMTNNIFAHCYYTLVLERIGVPSRGFDAPYFVLWNEN